MRAVVRRVKEIGLRMVNEEVEFMLMQCRTIAVACRL